MRYFPINLDICGRRVVVVGGGVVASRKVAALCDCGAAVTVVSPEFCPELAETPGLVRCARAYRSGDLAGACLVIGATDCEAVNRQVWDDARAAGVPCNIVDQPELCSFTVPAVITRGDLVITVSTGGVSPALSARLRRKFEAELGSALEAHLRLLAEMRPVVRHSPLPTRERMRLLTAMAGAPITRLIEEEGEASARERLHQMLAEALPTAGQHGLASERGQR